MATASAAIFDLDGTLFAGHVWQGLPRYPRLQHRNRIWLYTFLAAHIALGILSQARLLDGERIPTASLTCRCQRWWAGRSPSTQTRNWRRWQRGEAGRFVINTRAWSATGRGRRKPNDA